MNSIRVSRRRACRNSVNWDRRKELNFNVEIYRVSLGDNDEPCLHRRGSRMGDGWWGKGTGWRGGDVTPRSGEAGLTQTAKSLRLLPHVNTMLARVKSTDRVCAAGWCVSFVYTYSWSYHLHRNKAEAWFENYWDSVVVLWYWEFWVSRMSVWWWWYTSWAEVENWPLNISAAVWLLWAATNHLTPRCCTVWVYPLLKVLLGPRARH